MHDQLAADEAPRVETVRVRAVSCERAADLERFGRTAGGEADAVLYERSLTPLVTAILPAGIYAEPLPPGVAGTVISPRANSLAADGWRVVQLVDMRLGNGDVADTDVRVLVLASPTPRPSDAAGAFTANGLAG